MSRILFFIALVAATMVVLAFAAYQVFGPFQPEKEIKRMLLAMSQVETVRHETGFSWTKGEPRVTTTLFSKGQINLSEPDLIEHGSRYRVVRVKRGANFDDQFGEIRRLGEKTYVLEGDEETNSWVVLNPSERVRYGDLIPGLEIPVLGREGQVVTWTPEGIEKLRQLLSIADVFQMDSYDGFTEMVSGVNTRVLGATFDSDMIRVFLREVIRVKYNREPTNEERIRVDEQAKVLEQMRLQFWIGVKDHLLYKIQAVGNIDEEFVLDLKIEFSDFNEPFAVTAPSRVIGFLTKKGKTFLPIAGELTENRAVSNTFSGGSMDLPGSVPKEIGDTDGDGLNDMLETFYGTDKNNIDSDGDGVSDGNEVLRGSNPNGKGSLFGFGLGR